MLRVESIASDLSALAPEWDALLDPFHPGAAFRSPAWLLSWWDSYREGRTPLVLTAREHGELIGLLPLYLERGPLGVRRARLMGDVFAGSDYLGLIARPADAPRVARALAEALRELGELQLEALCPDDALAAAIGGAKPLHRCPHVRTAGSPRDYLAARPEGTAHQLARRRKWLEKQLGYRIDRLETVPAIREGMAILLFLHRARWALDAVGSRTFEGARAESFQLRASEALARRGWARIYVMHVGGTPCAVLYGFRHGDRLAYYQAGHDPAWRQRAVGTVLLGHIIEECFREGLREFDLLRGDEAYKNRWANGERFTERLYIRGPGLRPWLGEQGRAAWATLRRAGKRVLPPQAVTWWQRRCG
jgi:CelD/BcsL family acetyltransferase involved in cellulose biosynthesis